VAQTQTQPPQIQPQTHASRLVAHYREQRNQAEERAISLEGRLLAAEIEVRHLRAELHKTQATPLRAYTYSFRELPADVGNGLTVSEAIAAMSRFVKHTPKSPLVAVGKMDEPGIPVAGVGCEMDTKTGQCQVVLWLGSDPLKNINLLAPTEVV